MSQIASATGADRRGFETTLVPGRQRSGPAGTFLASNSFSAETRASPRTVPTVDAARHLDPRVWLVWLAAITVPALIARNPFPLFALLIVVLTVRAAWAPALARDAGWTFILRFAIVAAAVSVAFNALTAPFGAQVLVALPSWWPFGDVVTANAILFGVLSAAAIVVILLAGTTAGLLTDWPELLRAVPARFLPLAVAGSVAWSFVPQTVATLRDIRDAQRVRGFRLSSARTLVPLLVPLLATSLERATTMAEALEARGFGGPVDARAAASHRGSFRAIATLVGLTLAVAGSYLLLDGSVWPGGAAGGFGLVALGWALSGHSDDARSRYRARAWRRRDTTVLTAALGSLIVTGLTLALFPDALRYSPYPDIPLPRVNVPFLLSLGLLLGPAAIAPLVATSATAARLALDPETGSPAVLASATLKVTPFSIASPPRRRQVSGRSRQPWAGWPARQRGGPAPRQRLRRDRQCHRSAMSMSRG